MSAAYVRAVLLASPPPRRARSTSRCDVWRSRVLHPVSGCARCWTSPRCDRTGCAGSASPPDMRPTSSPSGQRPRRFRPDTGRQRIARFVQRRDRLAVPASFPCALRLRRPTRHVRHSVAKRIYRKRVYTKRISVMQMLTIPHRCRQRLSTRRQISARPVASQRPRLVASPDTIRKDCTIRQDCTGANPTPARQHTASFSIHPDLSI